MNKEGVSFFKYGNIRIRVNYGISVVVFVYSRLVIKDLL